MVRKGWSEVRGSDIGEEERKVRGGMGWKGSRPLEDGKLIREGRGGEWVWEGIGRGSLVESCKREDWKRDEM